ncbi:MAG TPA: hypothetical protein VFF52_25015 [Isosphaeraceae bacterium]|nr:hypothetical protein [Isosphaeraceae bacterium]
MTVLNCPICGTAVRVPQVDARTGLCCRKCHTPFHRNKFGDVVVGEPRGVDPDLEDLERELVELKQKLRDLRKRIPVMRIVAGLVVGVSVFYLFGPAERLDRAAERAARAFAEDDEDYLESIAVPGTAADVARWFAAAHRRLVQNRTGWYGPAEVIEVHVAEEDRSHGRGVVGVSIHPGVGTTLDVSLADPAAATASAPAPFNLETVWTRSWWGRWMLNVRDTNVRSQPTPGEEQGTSGSCPAPPGQDRTRPGGRVGPDQSRRVGRTSAGGRPTPSGKAAWRPRAGRGTRTGRSSDRPSSLPRPGDGRR